MCVKFIIQESGVPTQKHFEQYLCTKGEIIMISWEVIDSLLFS